MFVSKDGKAKKITELFCSVDGKAKKITGMFGSADGIAKSLFTEEKPAENGFDKFTWAEIKQLATDGKLLDHFALHDKVTVKFKDTISYAFDYTRSDGTMGFHTFYQDEIVFQINELTANTMRLSSYHATILDGSMDLKETASGMTEENPQYYFAKYFRDSSHTTRYYVRSAWGLTSVYNACKTIDEVLPDDLRNVLTNFKPLVKYVRYDTGQEIIQYDDCRVHQMSVFNWKVKRNDEDVPWTYDIEEIDFPIKKSAYKKYRTPLEGLPLTTGVADVWGQIVCENFAERRHGVLSIYHKGSTIPKVAHGWDRSYKYHVDNAYVRDIELELSGSDIIPEILIEGDVEETTE